MSLEKEICLNERPYEKCKQHGPESLTDSELLAVFIRTGLKNKSCITIARELIGDNKDGKGILQLLKSDFSQLTKHEGIGEVKAIQLLCMFELSKRLWRMNISSGISFTSPESIASYYMEELRHLSVEKTKVMLLNTKGLLIRDMEISSGTVNSSCLSARELFINALKCEAVNIVLIHNHPSGVPTPSAEDISITRTIKQAGDFIGIRLIDHVIIGDNCFVSLAREGYI